MIKLYKETGWVSHDENKIQYPWYVEGVLNILDKMDLKGKRVFEFGVGHSTAWWRSRGAIVEGVDSNPEWALLSGIKNITVDPIEYVTAIQKYPKFDIVVIDGIYRDECFHYAFSNVKEGGMIIIDNWHQPSVDPSPNAWTETEMYIELNELVTEVHAQPNHDFGDWKTLIVHT